MHAESARLRGRKLAQLLGSWAMDQRPSSSALHSAVRQSVLDGRLAPGTRLPAEREFAEAVGASRTLVTSALERLRADGFVESRRGAGSWVVLPEGGTEAGSGGWFPPKNAEAINFAQATPAAPPELTAAIEAARSRFTEQIGDHGYQPHGLRALRERIADHFTRRGLPTGPHQVLVTNGAQHAFALTLRMLIAPGERVLVEHPTYPNALEAIRAVNATALPVPMVGGDWDPELVEATLSQGSPRLAYLIPDFQNPTGALMSGGNRDRLAAALRRHRTTAVVDETLVDINLSADTVPPPMASFAEDHVISIGSASKSFWGGLRLGWVRAPEEFVHRMVLGRAAVDLGSPVFEQLVLAELLDGAAPRLRQRCHELAERRDELAATVRELCPQWSFRIPDGGLSLWCDLGRPISSKLAVAAEQHGVRMASGARFAVHGSLEHYARLPYTLPADRLRTAVSKLALAWAAVGGTDAADPWQGPVT